VQFHGTLKFFKSERPNGGFGFIIRDDNPSINDFFHVSELHRAGINPDALEEGSTRFSYGVEKDAKNGKLKAVDLRIVD
jgi:cold shock CspA family protein